MSLESEKYFTADGWRLNPIAIKKSWASVVIEDVPGFEECRQIENLLEGQEVKLIYRNVFPDVEGYILSKTVALNKGKIDKLLYDYSVSPFMIVSDSPELLMFVEDGNEYHIICGPKGTVESIIGETIAQARQRFERYATIPSRAGPENMKKIAKTYFRDAE